jgi:DNA-binding MarR family transcriptional regulator
VTDDPTGARAPAGEAELTDPFVLAEHVRLTLVRVGRRLRHNDPPGLSVTLYSALAVLADHGELAIGELAEAERVPSSAATRIADKLEEAGWVARRPNPHDRRGVNLAITAAGRRQVQDRRQAACAWLASRLAELSPAQRVKLADALAILDSAACDELPVRAPDLVTAGTEVPG